jgi:two-component system phosphate regulon response regulator PhoB
MKRVLIVDDQADLRRLVRWSLEGLDVPVDIHEATGAASGLQAAASLQPALVILDVMMPGPMDGLEACRRIRATPSLASARVILLSARGQEADVRAGTEAGAHAYIVKPFSPQRLLEAVEKQLADPPPPSPSTAQP